MNNAEVFKRMFGIYAEEFWAFPEDKMLDWLQYENVADTNVGDLISRQAMRQAMYHEAFEKDSEEQKWESGCWIRYKMFERVIDAQPSVQPEILACGQGELVQDGSRLVQDCISRQAVIDAFYLQSDDDGWWCGTVEDMETLLKSLPSEEPEPEHTMEEFMYGQDLGSPEDGSL